MVLIMASMVRPHFKMPTTTKVHEEYLFRDGVWSSTVKVVRNSVAAIDARFWYALAVWATCALINYTWAQYNTGKIALLNARAKNVDAAFEYVAVVDAVSAASWTTFLDSLVLPYTFIQHVIPWLVIWLNPK